MRLVGETSGAEGSVVNDLRLVTDEKGSLQGSFFIPDVFQSNCTIIYNRC